jgi:hypothetical protein
MLFSAHLKITAHYENWRQMNKQDNEMVGMTEDGIVRKGTKKKMPKIKLKVKEGGPG